jgi:hypothetical protein
VVVANDIHSIVVKLWNEQVNLAPTAKVGDNIVVRNVVTTIFKGVTSLNSTEQTKIEVITD